MGSQLYSFLSNIGYHHPLHPAVTHLPVGLTIASFIFIALSFVFKKTSFLITSKHCIVLALLATLPTILFGYLDWQHYYDGALAFPIKMKIGLAVALLIALTTISLTGKKGESATISRLMLHFLCLLLVVGLGYFGGELVYRVKSTSSQAASNDGLNDTLIVEGAKLFESHCAFCHFTDSTDTKVGPGLKEIFQKKEMPVSGWPVSEESVERQLKTPFADMPAFVQMGSEDITALTEYLKSL